MNGPSNNPEDHPPAPFITYQLLNVRQAVGVGITEPVNGEVGAVIKQDGNESRAQIYSEYVAARLAGLLGVPVATGVLVSHSRGLRYASLLVAQVGFKLTTVDDSNAVQVTKIYPVECARIAVFDAWIANLDRSGNLLANLASSTDNVIVGLDHGGCLLSAADDIRTAMDRLQGLSWGRDHLFKGLLNSIYVEAAVQRVARLSDESINDACLLNGTVGSVMLLDQVELAQALIARRDNLPKIVARVL